MEIDHFNPLLKGASRNKYANLFLASRHCNGSKSNTWPSRSARKKGIHFLNPCEEIDYGVHIVEHPLTHRLIGLTPAGDFHITCCDLNAIHLVEERRERAKIHNLLSGTGITSKQNLFDTAVLEPIELLREQLDKMIPLIPYLPEDHPAYQEDLLVMQSLFQQGQGVKP